MTVAELITRLQQMPLDAEVSTVTECHGCGGTVDWVQLVVPVKLSRRPPAPPFVVIGDGPES